MKAYLKITLAYLLFGLLWIVFTDHAILLLTDELTLVTWMQLLKGSVFVALSSILIFFLTKRGFETVYQIQRTRQEEISRTVKEANYILLNYLNQMQLVTLEAERCKEFDRETLQLAMDVTEDAREEIAKLGQLASEDQPDQ